MELRSRALDALRNPDPEEKLALASAIGSEFAILPIAPGPLKEPAGVPGRPVLPRLVEPARVPLRSPHTREGRAALIHAICHIEFNAINLALDAVWRFGDMPPAYYHDWSRVAAEEAYHFRILHEHLQGLGFRYGDFEAHDGLWEMAEKTRHDIVARMALVPRTLEARGLDATPLIQARLRKAAEPGRDGRCRAPDALQAHALLDIILRDEIGHVAIGNHWYRWLCDRQNLDPLTHYATLARDYRAPRLRPPFNTPARQAAGFTPVELELLLGA
jgi:uncharacterized ferritin-like protein (DUF455 family)